MARPQREGTLASIPKRNIAIIEDDSGMLRSIACLLSTFGFDTEIFDSAEAFLAASSKASCLLVDINLDRMTGIELAIQLAERGIRYPIIFMTGRDNDSDRRKAEDVGAVAYLTKPFPARSLIGALIKATTQ